MIIVSGHLKIRPGQMQAFLALSSVAVLAARRTPGCLDFAVSADPVTDDRANIYEAWDSEDALLKFRGDGPGEDVSAFIVSAEVRRHTVSSTGAA